MARVLASMVAALAVAGAASAQPVAGKLGFQAGYFDAEDHAVLAGALPADIAVRFEIIAGSMAGKVNTTERLVVAARAGETALLDLDAVRAMAAPLAAVLTLEAREAGLTITPADARLARVATVAYDSRTRRGLGSTVFRDLAMHESLVLVYADRACRLAGIVRGRGAEIEYDVAIDGPGLRALKIRRESPTRYTARVAGMPDRVALRIEPRTPPPPVPLPQR